MLVTRAFCKSERSSFSRLLAATIAPAGDTGFPAEHSKGAVTFGSDSFCSFQLRWAVPFWRLCCNRSRSSPREPSRRSNRQISRDRKFLLPLVPVVMDWMAEVVNAPQTSLRNP